MSDGYMRRATELAKQSSRVRGLLPPYVGAVVVKNGEIVGEGYKRFFSNMRRMLVHAERSAINDAGFQAEGSILYTTLQPCTSTYKTVFQPCSMLAVKRGIRRVVVGLRPSYGLDTAGIRFMEEHGIEVTFCDDFQEELEALRRGRVRVA